MRIFIKRNQINRNAFSLVETLLAMTIMAIAISGILTSFTASLVATRISKDYALVDQLMGQLRGQLRANMFDPMQVNSGTFEKYPEFNWEISFSYSDMDNLYQVDLIIQWQRGQKNYRLSHVTYYNYVISQEEVIGS